MLSSVSPTSSGAVLLCTEAPLPIWKRTFDIAFLVIISPLIVLISFVVAAWITITSPGPVFFRQERVGHAGRRFMLYKFRTMSVDADATLHQAHFAGVVRANRPMQKLDAGRDPRLLPGGWLLRAAGLDELPQFINVLRGDMSLVGPRPCIPYEYEQYSAAQRGRFASAPGLTGLWQVSGKNRTTFDEMVRLDIQYSRTKSLWLDFTIVARTLPALCGQIADTRLLRRRHKQVPTVPTVPRGTPAGFQT